MMIGHGCIEIYDPRTGEVIEERANANVILEQGILGIIGDPGSGGTRWVAWNQWLIAIGDGYRNPPEANYLSGLDHQIWKSDGGNTTYTDLGNGAFTVTAEIDPADANGSLTEACLISDKAFNRLMFKSTPVLPAGTYSYYIINQSGTGASAQYSQPSNAQVLTTGGIGSLRLGWSQNYTGIVNKYHIFRKGPGDADFKLLAATASTFYIDAGFALASTVTPYTTTPTIASPTLAPLTFTDANTKQPKPVVKTADYAARIKITIQFTIEG